MQRTRTRAVAGGSEEPPASPSWVRAVKQLDFYYKADAEAGLLKRSKYGGMVTILCGLILAYLVLSELVSFLSADTVDVLTVDKRRGEKMSINVDVYFPALTCLDVAVDVVEASSGETIEEATHQIIKQRTDAYGKTLAEGVQKDLGSSWFRAAGGACPACLPKDSVPINLLHYAKKGKLNRKQCCYSCEDVRNFLLENGIPQSAAEHTEQCKIEKPVQENEGCRIRGFLEVPRGKGDFHIAAGAGFSQSHESHQHHMHQIDWSRIHKFNVSHVIHSLSFGPPLPNVVNPLDSHKIVAKTLAQHSYMIQVVPTTYESGSVTVHTNQYTFTQHHQKILGGQNFVLPGVYFKYDINPLMIMIKDHNPGAANFITRICAIVGGLYVVFGLVYSVSSKVVKTTTKKR